MKRIMCVFLSIILLVSLTSTAFATQTSQQNSAYTSYYCNTEKESVSADIVDTIINAHAQASPLSTNAVSSSSENILSDDDIDKELTHIYLDIDVAQQTFNDDPSLENQNIITALIERKDFLEATLSSRGYIFLSDDEAKMLMGSVLLTTSEEAPTPPTPTETSNTRYVMSDVKKIKLSDDAYHYYYYVTAYAKSTNSNMVAAPIIAMNVDKLQFYLNALAETYIGKFVSEALSYVSILAWAPYEIVGATPDLTAPCSYTVDALYTTTPRFVWLYSETYHNYYLEGILHTTNIADHHVMRYTSNGLSEIKSYDENYSFVSPLYQRPVNVIKKQWNSDLGHTYIEYVRDVEYYYQSDENKPSTRKLVSTQTAPYAYATYCMN